MDIVHITQVVLDVLRQLAFHDLFGNFLPRSLKLFTDGFQRFANEEVGRFNSGRSDFVSPFAESTKDLGQT